MLSSVVVNQLECYSRGLGSNPAEILQKTGCDDIQQSLDIKTTLLRVVICFGGSSPYQNTPRQLSYEECADRKLSVKRRDGEG